MPTFEQFDLPDAGEGLTEAEIVTWRVAVGDTVEINQPLVEIETAKSLVELPSPYAGVVVDLLVEEGRTVDVGTPIVIVDTDPHGPPAPAGATPAAAASGVGAADGAPAGDRDGATGADAAGGRGVSGARGATAGEGAAGQGAGSQGSGAVLVGYGVEEGATSRRARRGRPDPQEATAPSTTTAQAPGPASAPAGPGPDPARTATAPTATAPTATAPTAPAPTSGQATRSADPSPAVLAKPPVRKLARDLGVSLASIVPTGPGGIVTREDVLAFSAHAQARELSTYPGDDAPWLASGTVSPDGRQTRVPVKSVRKRTAEAMVASAFTAPHVTVFQTVDVTRTMKLVARLREDREFTDVRVTPLLICAKALLIAVDRHPETNASWDEATQEIVFKHYVNLGIAAATPRGLVVPNIKDAHRLRLKELAGRIADLTATARAGKTSPTDMADGTITITNVGVFGIDTGTPILNPGEAAILAFGAIREQPWVHKGKIAKRMVTQLALSVDHRLVDGELGSRLLADVAAVLQDPAQALVWG